MLSNDILTVRPQEILNTKVLLAVIGGPTPTETETFSSPKDHSRKDKVTVHRPQVRIPAAVFDAGLLLRKPRRCGIASLRQTDAQ